MEKKLVEQMTGENPASKRGGSKYKDKRIKFIWNKNNIITDK